MNAQTLKEYAPCLKHQLWHDLGTQCDYCLFEKVTGTTENDGIALL